jgi:transposase
MEEIEKEFCSKYRKAFWKDGEMGMDYSSLFALPDGLEVAETSVTGSVLTLSLVATAPTAMCPLCGQASQRIRSSYTRHVADVPSAGRQVQLVLRVRKFRCDTTDCPRRVFAERLTPFIEPWARMTTRLSQTIEAIGLATSGELGSRFAPRLGIVTSPTTILHRTMKLSPQRSGPVSQLGIDDWSFRRGRQFGTILVNLATHEIIDLLPDRETQTAQAWMQAHPEIDVVSRDRGEEYAAAARKGAPQARQVADRYHLTDNLRDFIEEILARCRTEISQASMKAQETGDDVEQTSVPPFWLAEDAPLAGSAHLARHAERLDRYQQLIHLRDEGFTQKEIARQLGMAERTVRHWLTRGIPYGKPELRHKRRRDFDPYAAYVRERFLQGSRNGLQLWRELQTQGYKGSPRAVYRFLAQLKQGSAATRGKTQRAQVAPDASVWQWTAKQAVWWFIRDPSDLKKKEQETLLAIRQASPTADRAYGLAQDFMGMLRHREGERLDVWLGQVRASHIPELQRFVRSIQQDKDAVLAGLTEPWSNGVVEGKINKLKLIKRIMYGRAEFPLLRHRVLYAL